MKVSLKFLDLSDVGWIEHPLSMRDNCVKFIKLPYLKQKDEVVTE